MNQKTERAIQTGTQKSLFGSLISEIGAPTQCPSVHIAADYGTPVRSIASGKVVTRGKDKGYGNYVVVQHSGGYESLYAHLSKIHVKKAQKVKRGTLIGSVGSTGLSTGPHLHLEIKKNKRYIQCSSSCHPFIFEK